MLNCVFSRLFEVKNKNCAMEDYFTIDAHPAGFRINDFGRTFADQCHHQRHHCHHFGNHQRVPHHRKQMYFCWSAATVIGNDQFVFISPTEKIDWCWFQVFILAWFRHKIHTAFTWRRFQMYFLSDRFWCNYVGIVKKTPWFCSTVSGDPIYKYLINTNLPRGDKHWTNIGMWVQVLVKWSNMGKYFLLNDQIWENILR